MSWQRIRRIVPLVLLGSALPFISLLDPARAVGEVVVVANTEVTEDVIERKDLQRIYLGKKTTWPDKTSIVPVMLKTGPVHTEFVEDVVGRSEHRFATYWRQMVFTGKGVPPKSFASESEIVNYVKATPGAVGYVSPGTDAAGVKILIVD
mgnify:CR=1 FL=1